MYDSERQMFAREKQDMIAEERGINREELQRKFKGMRGAMVRFKNGGRRLWQS